MAFTGTAVYDIFNNEIAEDVSEVVSMISPKTARFWMIYLHLIFQ